MLNLMALPKLGQIKAAGNPPATRKQSRNRVLPHTVLDFPHDYQNPGGQSLSRPGEGRLADFCGRPQAARKNLALTGAGRWDILPMGENSEKLLTIWRAFCWAGGCPLCAAGARSPAGWSRRSSCSCPAHSPGPAGYPPRPSRYRVPAARTVPDRKSVV